MARLANGKPEAPKAKGLPRLGQPLLALLGRAYVALALSVWRYCFVQISVT